MADSSSIPTHLRELLAKKEEAVAKLNQAAAELARQRSEIAALNAELLRVQAHALLNLDVCADTNVSDGSDLLWLRHGAPPRPR